RQRAQRRCEVTSDRPPADKGRRRAGDPGADPALEVGAHALRDQRRSPLALEALELEPQAANPLPEVGVVHSPLVAVDRVRQGPERMLAALRGRGLDRGVKRRGPWVLAGYREVPEDELQGQLGDPDPGRRAVWAAEVKVSDRLRPLAPNVVLGPHRGHTGARQL